MDLETSHEQHSNRNRHQHYYRWRDRGGGNVDRDLLLVSANGLSSGRGAGSGNKPFLYPSTAAADYWLQILWCKGLPLMPKSRVFAATVLIALILLSVLFASGAHAQPVSAQIIDTVVTRFRTTLAGYEGGLQAIARNTFAILAGIQFFWAMAKLALKRPDFGEIVAEVVNQFLFLGFFFFMLTTATTWGPAIIRGFVQAGTNVGAVAMAPGSVFAAGVDLAVAAMSQVRVLHPEDAIGLIICALVILICFSWITAAMVIALVQSYFMLSAGVLFMALGATHWTNQIAVSVIRTVLGIGAKLFALQLITAIGTAFIQQWVAQFNGDTAVSQNMMIEIGQSIVLLAVTQTIPAELERMVAGSSLAGAGALAGAAAELGGAAAALSMATAKLATSVAGAGAVMGAANQLAGAQMDARVAAGTAPTSRLGRAATVAAGTIGNAGSAVGTDIGRRLSGQSSSRMGVAGFRQASDLAERSRLLNEQSSAPTPPRTP
jgi:type IV secretion system protein TrbL